MTTPDTTLAEGVSPSADSQVATADQTPAATPEPIVTEAPVETPEPTTRPRSNRQDVLASAIANRRKVVEAEIAEENGEPAPTDEPSVTEPPVTEAPTPEPSATTAPVSTEAPAAGMVTIKVNGQERQITVEEAAKLAQRGVAADETWRAAKQLRDDAERLARSAGTQQTPAPTAAPAPTESPVALSKEEIAKVAAALQMGTEEEGAAALETLITKLAKEGRGDAATPVDVEAIKSQVTDHLRAEADFTRTVQTVGREFPEIFGEEQPDGTAKGGDPILIRLAGEETHKIRAHLLIALGYPAEDVMANLAVNPTEIKRVYDLNVKEKRLQPELAVFREACKRISSWDKQRRQPPAATSAPAATAAPAPQPTTQPAAGTRIERKAGLQNQPTPGSARAPLGTPAPQPKTGSAIVADMRKRRGLPPQG